MRLLSRRAQEPGTSATRSRPGPVPLRREAQKESVASRAPPRRDWGAAHRASQSASKRPDLRSIISSKKRSWGLRAQDPGGVPPLGGAWKISTENKDSFLAPSGGCCSISIATGVSGSSGLQRNVTCSVASCHVSGHRTSNIPHQGEVSKLVSLSEKLAAWKLLPNISPWVERTVEKGYKIQFAYRPPRFNGVVSTSVKLELVDLLTQESQALLDKGAIEHVPLPDRESGYYARWGVATNFRSSRIEPLPQILQVQNVDSQDDCVSDPIGGLVRDNRSQGRIFSRRNIATAQEVPEVRFRGRSLPVSGSSIRPSFVTPHVYEMHGCSTGSSATPGHPHFKLHRRLADSGTVSRACASTSRCRLSSSRISGFETQRQEKRSLSCSENNVSGGCMGFDHDAGTAVSCTRRIHSKCPKEHQARPENYCSLPSEGSRSHGSCIHGDTLGPPADEIVSVVAQSQGISSKGQSPEANKGYAPGASYPFYVVQTPVSDFGSHSRSVLSSQDANDRRFPHGLGCGLGWPSSPRDLERPSSRLAHQLPRNDGSISGPEILPPAVERLPCPSAGGQHGSSLLHKSPGRTAFALPEQTSAAGSALGTGQVPVPQGDLHPRAYECGSRLAVQTSCETWGMETPPRNSSALLPGVLAKVRQQRSRLLLLAPRWTTRIWFSDLISLLDGSPWAVPVRKDLLSQAQGTVFHNRPELWNLHVWPLRGTNWEMLSFRPT